MGDRANVAIIQEDGVRVYLYTHWSGHRLLDDVHRALARRQRWDDIAYLTRIVFCEMLRPSELMDETGYGISTGICDNQHPIIVLDPKRRKCWLETRDGQNIAFSEHTFEDFVRDRMLLQVSYCPEED